MVSLTLIVAATCTNGIGQGSHLPWRLPSEMAYFARVTKAAPSEHVNAVIMGRKTWESIPKSRRPLVDRVNVIITSNPKHDLGQSQSPSPSLVERSLEVALSRLSDLPTSTRINRRFVIGGASVYRETLALKPLTPALPVVDRILLTRVLSPAFDDCDVFFPEFRSISGWNQASHEALEAWVGFEVARGVQTENGVEYEFQMWIRDV
ncbi:dihydrofolate reductase-like domain-containing protein [Gautieria morchelliformis]|nr:dihydrofolate reductase-like domain-containing protein [Gautieria morchelliformis]